MSDTTEIVTNLVRKNDALMQGNNSLARIVTALINRYSAGESIVLSKSDFAKIVDKQVDFKELKTGLKITLLDNE